MKLVLATRNQGKLREIEPLFHDTRIRLVSLNDLGVAEKPEEDSLEGFTSFSENAVSKAQYFHDRTGLPMMAHRATTVTTENHWVRFLIDSYPSPDVVAGCLYEGG